MEITTIGHFVVVDIRKPMNWDAEDRIYDVVRVWKDYFLRAKKLGYYVLVRTNKGERVFMPKAMKGFKTVKETFLFADRPMRMYQLVIPHCTKKENDYYVFRYL